MSEAQALSKEGNRRAISVRIKPRTKSQATGQRQHDLRLGGQPAYVDAGRTHLNEILIEPIPAHELLQVCTDRRANRNPKPKRAMKSNAAVASCGIITFGIEAQVMFEALDPAIRSAAIRAVAEAIAERLKTTLTGLVIHWDETAGHAHFQMPAINIEGNPLTQANSLSDIARLQDLAADVIQHFAPFIERGNKRRDRIRTGATPAEVRYRQVHELHYDLPIESERLRDSIAELERKKEGLEAEVRMNAEAIMASEKQAILDEAAAMADKVLASARHLAGILIEGAALILENKLSIEADDVRTSEDVDPEVVKGLRPWASVLKRLYYQHQDLHKKAMQRSERLGNLVHDLEAVFAEMTEQQRQKFNEARGEVSDLSPL